MKLPVGIVLAAFGISLAAWFAFYVWSEPLQPAETGVIVALSVIVVLAVRWASGRLRRRTDKRTDTAGFVALALIAPGVARSDASVLACSPATPVAQLGGKIELRAFASVDRVTPVFRWTADAGRITGTGPKVTWELPQDEPRLYTAIVTTDGGGTCEIRIYALRSPPERGVETRRLYLPRDLQEPTGYARYSYLLFGSTPRAATRERYVKALAAYTNLLFPLEKMRNLFPPNELNITSLPLNIVSRQKVQNDPEWLLANYDFERARFLLRSLPGTNNEGPYLVSYSRPLTTVGKLSGEYLFQDLSSVPPRLVELWVKEFENQSAQEQFWKVRSGSMLALRLRTAIGVLAEGDQTVRNALALWIQWVSAK